MKNTIKYIFCFFLACFISCYSCYSQEKSRYKCAYQFDFLSDTITMSYFRKEIYIVQIGDKITKGFTYQKFYLDSLKKASPDLAMQMSKALVKEGLEAWKSTGDMSHLNNSSFHLGAFTSDLYKDYKKNEIRVKENNLHSFNYKDELKAQDWEILNDTTTILGYYCQKAQCHWRGRDWEAWFTSEIPISEGPWKFYGLPGLITKLHDTKNHYSFELTGFQEIRETIDTKIKNSQKIERKEYLRMQFGRKGELITEAEMAKVGLSHEPNKRNYDYIERDYKE